MARITIVLTLHLLFLAGLYGGRATAADVTITHLQTEYTHCPLGIDVTHPRFSWQMETALRGYAQAAYQLEVSEPSGKNVWNSGKVPGDISVNIRYAGQALRPKTRYHWKVTVWDKKGGKHTQQSWFETGLMETGALYAAWNNARWIGGTDLVCYSPYLPVFRLNYTIQLDEATHSTHAGFIYGANDPRLLHRDKNFMHLQSPKDSTWILVELDIAPLQTDSAALLHIYRAGYSAKDTSFKPLKSFRIPDSLLNKSNQYARHTFYLSSVLGDTRISMDAADNTIASLNLNPLGTGGDFIAYPVAGELGLFVPAGQKAHFSDIEIRNYRSPYNVLYADKEQAGKAAGTGLFGNYKQPEMVIQKGAYTVTAGGRNFLQCALPKGSASPMLRTAFTAGGQLAKARLYVSARGVYDFYINGKRVGDEYFNPGLTQYNKTQLYQTFDVTSAISAGKNAMGAVLAEGWWSGGATYMGDSWNFFGDKQSLLAQLILTYTDGREEVVVTTPERWKSFEKGPLLYGSLFQGEVYDASREQATRGWSTAAYADTAWKTATEVSLDKHTSVTAARNGFAMPVTEDYEQLHLVGQYGPAVKKVKELSAVSVATVRPGVYIYDMGQNMAGVPRIALEGVKPGSCITLRFAEVKYPQLPAYEGNGNMLMLENIRAAMAQDMYIARGGKEQIQPRFTLHGYRYIEITGLPEPLPLSAVKGDVLSSVHQFASAYESSVDNVNQLWKNITWSTLANFMSVPTDCPQRNERLGWSGDISVFSRTATYLAYLPQFFRRHMQAMRDVQSNEGRFSDVAPMGGGFGGVLWGSAGITVAWESYAQYGDTGMIAEHYDAMKSYIDYLVKHIDPQTHVLNDQDRTQWSSLGDWLSPEYDRTEKSLLWEAYFIYDLQLMERMATALGKTADASWLHRLYLERKAFFNQTYVDAATGKTVFRNKVVDTQASYAIPLQFHLFDEAYEAKAAANLAAAVMRSNKADDGTVCPPYSLMTGFIGTAWINSALSEYGHTETAYRLLQQTQYPSWLYPVTQGATTIWERLNSYTHTSGFGGNNRMNSFNHYSFGAVGAWMYEHSLGIQRAAESPAFKHFILSPEPDPTGAMTYARGHYECVYGRIESSWKQTPQGMQYQFTVPANTSATLLLTAKEAGAITEAGKLLSQAKGVQYQGVQKGKHRFVLTGGKYNVAVRE